MEFFGAMIGLTFVWWAVVLTIASVLFPIFWIWMLIDSILREDAEYPAGNVNEKLVWVLLMVLVQFVAVVYFFMVYRKVPRRRSVTIASEQGLGQPPVPPQTPVTA